MQLKRYEAKSVNEAMVKIKKDLGPDAVVLSSKRLKGDKGTCIEVIAARDEDLALIGEESVARDTALHSGVYAALKNDIDHLKTLVNDFTGVSALGDELAEIRETMNTLCDFWGCGKSGRNSSPLTKAYYHLVAAGISKRRSCEIIAQLQDDRAVTDVHNYQEMMNGLEKTIRKTIAPCYSQAVEARICAFVGPAGAGKTTTLAKLAAAHKFRTQAKVGIITMDTHRIGAEQQLKTYADIMDVPMVTATEKDEFRHSIQKFTDRDMILVDTPGKSRKDDEYLAQLKDILMACAPMETHLVLSATESREDMMEAARRFGVTDYNDIIFTKLDDSTRLGTLFNVVDQTNKPVSYVSNGQNVPQDIHKIDPARLARLIIENRVHGNSFALSH